MDASRQALASMISRVAHGDIAASHWSTVIGRWCSAITASSKTSMPRRTTDMPSMLISTAMFERHLDWIGRHFRFVGSTRSATRVRNGVPFDEPVAAITFDDGYQDVYENAVPILKRKGIPAAAFVVTDLVGTAGLADARQALSPRRQGVRQWDDPRRQLYGLLRDLGLPESTILRDAQRDAVAAADRLGVAAEPVTR